MLWGRVRQLAGGTTEQNTCVVALGACGPLPLQIVEGFLHLTRIAFGQADEVLGGVFGALTVGILGDHVSGPVGSIGDAMSLVTVAMLPAAMVVCWLFVPETNAEDMVAMDEAVLVG